MSKQENPHHELIYRPDWRRWTDPQVPELFNPTTLVLDEHIKSGRGRKTALIVDDRSFSYAELLSAVEDAAHRLAGAGLQPEARILLFGTDSLEYLSVWFGAQRLGAVPVVVADGYKSPNVLYFLENTGASVLFIDAEQLGKLRDVANRLPTSLRRIVVRGKVPADLASSKFPIPVVSLGDLDLSGRHPFAPLLRHRNDIGYLFYSGGTTGTAKGIPHLLEDFVLIPARHGAFWEYTASDRVHATSKKYFSHGLWPGLQVPLTLGATVIISRLPATPDNVIRIVESHRPTKLITVPTVIKGLLREAEDGRAIDFASVRHVFSASEKVAPEIFVDFRRRFGIELLDSIGSAEVTYEWIANRPGDFKRGSLGRPVFGVEVKLVDPSGREVKTPDTVGEAHVRSRTAALFYWRKLDETLATMGGGWVRTGDELSFDRDGYFWFSGRSNDVFKVKGLWVSPIEVEAVITADPDIHEAAVIPFTDEDGLTKPKAFVVLKPGRRPSEDLSARLREQIHAAIGGYKVPGAFEYVERLPLTTLLKIDRRSLREAEAVKATATAGTAELVG